VRDHRVEVAHAKHHPREFDYDISLSDVAVELVRVRLRQGSRLHSSIDPAPEAGDSPTNIRESTASSRESIGD
jgi:hypothetical protein